MSSKLAGSIHENVYSEMFFAIRGDRNSSNHIDRYNEMYYYPHRILIALLGLAYKFEIKTIVNISL
jgi:hypothetical protein